MHFFQHLHCWKSGDRKVPLLFPVSPWNGQWPCSDLCGSCTNHHPRRADHLTVSVLWGSISSKLTAPALNSNQEVSPSIPGFLHHCTHPERDSGDSSLSLCSGCKAAKIWANWVALSVDFSDHSARCLQGRTQESGIWSNVAKRGCHESAWNPRIHKT